MDKQAIINFLKGLEDYSSLSEDIRRARQECCKNKWDQITLEKIEYGIALYHNKPCLLQVYINEVLNG